MSPQTATARATSLPLRVPTAPAPRRTAPLRLVPPRRSTAAKAPFVVTVVTLLALGLLGLLTLNTVVAQDSFRLHDLAKQGRQLDLHEQQLELQVQAASAPGALAARATELGMVPGGSPAFLRLRDGRILGAPVAGQPPVKPAAPAAHPAGPAPAAGSVPPTAQRTAAKPAVTKPSTTRPTTTRPAATKPTTTKPTATKTTGR